MISVDVDATSILMVAIKAAETYFSLPSLALFQSLIRKLGNFQLLWNCPTHLLPKGSVHTPKARREFSVKCREEGEAKLCLLRSG